MNINLPPKFKNIFDKYRFKVFYGGRASAKSWTAAQYLLIRALQKKVLILATREYQSSIRDSSKALIEQQIDRLKLRGFFRSTRNEIIGINASKFIFKGLKLNPSAIKGTEDVDIVWCEEAQNTSRTSLDFLIPTIRKPGSELLFTFNPYLDTDPVFQDFVLDKRDNALVVKVNYYDNPYVSEESLEEMRWTRKRNKDKYNHVWLGDTLKLSEALVFNNWKIDAFYNKYQLPHFYGLDFGFSVDPTALVELFIDHDTRTIYINNELYKIGVEIDHLPAFLDGIKQAKNHWIIADSARPDTISYLNRHGYKVKSAQKGHNSIVEGVELINSYDVVIHPRCVNTIYEFSNYSYKVDSRTGLVLPQIIDKHNHIIDALRYALSYKQKKVKIQSLGDF